MPGRDIATVEPPFVYHFALAARDIDDLDVARQIIDVVSQPKFERAGQSIVDDRCFRTRALELQ